MYKCKSILMLFTIRSNNFVSCKTNIYLEFYLNARFLKKKKKQRQQKRRLHNIYQCKKKFIYIFFCLKYRPDKRFIIFVFNIQRVEIK